MKAYDILGQVDVPEHILSLVPRMRRAWQKSGRMTWELPRRQPWQLTDDREYLDEAASEFVSSTLLSFGVTSYHEHGHSLLLFGNVTRHSDVALFCKSRPAAFFHLILNGSGTLRLPGLQDKQAREVELTKGLAFWFNPRIAHMVKNASDEGLASLTATIQLPRLPSSTPQ